MPSYENPSNQEIIGKKRCKIKNICDRPLNNQHCLECCKSLNSSLILSSENYSPYISNSFNCRDAVNSYSNLCCCGDDPSTLKKIISTLIAKYFAGNTYGTCQTTLSTPFQITEEIKNYKNKSNCYYKTADIPKIFFKDANVNLKKGRGSKRKCFKRKTQIDSSKLNKNKLHSTHPIRDKKYSASDNININTKISKIPIPTKPLKNTTEKARYSNTDADKWSISLNNESKYSSNKQSKGQSSNKTVNELSTRSIKETPNNRLSRNQTGNEFTSKKDNAKRNATYRVNSENAIYNNSPDDKRFISVYNKMKDSRGTKELHSNETVNEISIGSMKEKEIKRNQRVDQFVNIKDNAITNTTKPTEQYTTNKTNTPNEQHFISLDNNTKYSSKKQKQGLSSNKTADELSTKNVNESLNNRLSINQTGDEYTGKKVKAIGNATLAPEQYTTSNTKYNTTSDEKHSINLDNGSKYSSDKQKQGESSNKTGDKLSARNMKESPNNRLSINETGDEYTSKKVKEITNATLAPEQYTTSNTKYNTTSDDKHSINLDNESKYSSDKQKQGESSKKTGDKLSTRNMKESPNNRLSINETGDEYTSKKVKEITNATLAPEQYTTSNTKYNTTSDDKHSINLDNESKYSSDKQKQGKSSKKTGDELSTRNMKESPNNRLSINQTGDEYTSKKVKEITNSTLSPEQYTTSDTKYNTTSDEKHSINLDNESKYSSNKQKQGLSSNKTGDELTIRNMKDSPNNEFTSEKDKAVTNASKLDRNSISQKIKSNDSAQILPIKDTQNNKEQMNVNNHIPGTKNYEITKLDFVANEQSINIPDKIDLQNTKLNDSQYSDTQNMQKSDKYNTADSSHLPNGKNDKTNDVNKDSFSNTKDENIKMSHKSDLLSQKSGFSVTTSKSLDTPDKRATDQQSGIPETRNTRTEQELGKQEKNAYNNLSSEEEANIFDNRNNREKSDAAESDLEQINNSNDVSTNLKITRASTHDTGKYLLEDRFDFEKTEEKIIDPHPITENKSTVTQINRKSNYSSNRISIRLHWDKEFNRKIKNKTEHKIIDPVKENGSLLTQINRNSQLNRKSNYNSTINTRLHWDKDFNRIQKDIKPLTKYSNVFTNEDNPLQQSLQDRKVSYSYKTELFPEEKGSRSLVPMEVSLLQDSIHRETNNLNYLNNNNIRSTGNQSDVNSIKLKNNPYTSTKYRTNTKINNRLHWVNIYKGPKAEKDPLTKYSNLLVNGNKSLQQPFTKPESIFSYEQDKKRISLILNSEEKSFIGRERISGSLISPDNEIKVPPLVDSNFQRRKLGDDLRKLGNKKLDRRKNYHKTNIRLHWVKG